MEFDPNEYLLELSKTHGYKERERPSVQPGYEFSHHTTLTADDLEEIGVGKADEVTVLNAKSSKNMAKGTKIQSYTMVGKLLSGLAVALFFGILGILFMAVMPIIGIILLILALGAPGMFLFHQGQGKCPYCGQDVEVTKKNGGLRCKGCRNSMKVQDGRIYPI